MLLQNTLDLSTFEIVRFRIWNQTSNPDDYGIGTKYFNTNSGHEGYNRENIYTETGWRRTAYLDDIEAITNGKGSLGTRVKALEDMLGLEDVTDVIDTWNDVKEFFANVDEGLDLMTMLDGKLDKKGGDMTGALKISSAAWANQLTLNGVGQNAGIRFSKDNVQNGILYANGQSLRWYTGDNDVSIITGSNALDQLKGTFLPLTGGTVTGELTIRVDGISRLSLGSLGSIYTNTADSSIVINNAGAGYPSFKIAGGVGHPVFRYGSIDNVVLHAGNVGEYAVKYDGTASVDKARHSIGLDNGSQGSSNLPVAGGGGYISFGHDSYGSQLFGGFASNRLFLRSYQANEYGDWREIAFTDSTVAAAYKLKNPSTNGDVVTITEDGRVLINRPSAIFDRQLSIGSGGVFVSATLAESPVLGSVGSNSLLVGASTYGMQHWALGNGQGNIQVGRFDGTATAYALNLNPLGGAVNIASANANTNVLGHIFASKDLYMNGFLMMNRGKEGIYMAGTSINWHNANNAYTDNLLAFAKDSITVYQPTKFTNRVLIGGATDDGETALQVSEGVLVSSTSTWKNETAKMTVSGLSLKARSNGGYYQGVFYFKSDGSQLAFSGINTTNEVLDSYFIGPNANVAGPWFAINSTESAFNVLTKFNAGALIPTGQKMTFGVDGPTMEYDADANAIKVTGNIYATGTVASGGKAEEGEGGTGGASGTIREFTIEPPTDNTSSFKLEHSFNTEKVIVQIFGLNGNSGKYEMILTDVEITDANNVTVTFGRKPTEYHKVYVMA